MVQWVPDATKRFPKRPHFEPMEIDRECEALTAAFLLKHRGKISYPITTDDLCLMIEQHVVHLDVYSDLSADGMDVEGVTRIQIGKSPIIEITESLSTEDRRANRYRTTLAHELGHVRLHDRLFQSHFSSGELLPAPDELRIVCKRDGILDAPSTDWMEWQAGYASGAYLMPRFALRDLLRPTLDTIGALSPFHVVDAAATSLMDLVMQTFQVSRDAARVRLLKLGYLTARPVEPTLFG
ncbi:ImmA/IrrE family metallo-endopeptidase [Methylobacterium sp. J-077]|uniref:ImmA/IrrE family metallo-endopeptidase n=1 Tax=Methylobacterium sp. J-077 TaxID=2836656 RepID=UPI001FBA1723|nr:ImmA/IrrE family metallo-endopeptidase [Methylobacterium sp. J-077]MCJ2124578.1 ImmA/IrrE family metallo-endopeptidase [Methylobacterium sp. J-077]